MQKRFYNRETIQLYKDFNIGWKSLHFIMIGWDHWIYYSSCIEWGVWKTFVGFYNSARLLFLYFKISFFMLILHICKDLIINIKKGIYLKKIKNFGKNSVRISDRLSWNIFYDNYVIITKIINAFKFRNVIGHWAMQLFFHFWNFYRILYNGKKLKWVQYSFLAKEIYK